jgi:hypothetical protein
MYRETKKFLLGERNHGLEDYRKISADFVRGRIHDLEELLRKS